MGGVSILQYVDDTINFMEHDIAKAWNIKLVLCLFEQLCRLKLNFNKSELFCFGRTKEEQDAYRKLFRCEMGSLSFSDLGILVHYRSLTNREWKCIEDRLKKDYIAGRASLCLMEVGLC
uniref:Reverse transcriptase domain-containing protein n=1 Tax=Hordeum vulgare subsp. vulgare TaxID=112509 RepID=A0A8I6WJ66_HORVV